MPPPQPPPPPYVEHQKAKTIKNDVNLHKDTIRLEPDVLSPDHHLVSFTYDSLVDGSVTIFYFAKEGADCTFSPVYPDIYMPVSIPFQKGVHQKFCQTSGSGIDLGFFESDDLSKPSSEDVFPLVIYAEASSPPPPEEINHSKAASRAQITLAVIERKADGAFLVKVVKQILWIDGQRYELQEIFGIGSSVETGIDGNDDENDDDIGKECVICLSEPRDTAVLPCRHMCMCSECAKALRLQSNKCPICRQPVEKLMEIKVKRTLEQ